MSENMQNGKVMRGHLTLFAEQGVGPAWSLAREEAAAGTYPTPIKNGDFLRVFKDAAGETVEWEGAVDLDPTIGHVTFRAVAEHDVVVTRTEYSDHGFPRDRAHQWAAWFIHGRKAELVTAASPAP